MGAPETGRLVWSWPLFTSHNCAIRLLLPVATRVPSGEKLMGAVAPFRSVSSRPLFTFHNRTVSPAVATSYAFVNPVIAVLLGVGLGRESIGWSAALAMVVILLGVALVVARRPRGP